MCRPGFATPVSFLSLPASNVHMGNEVMPKPQPSGLQCWHRRTTNQSKQLRISKKAEELKGIDGMISFWILETSWDFFYWMNFLWCCLFIVSLSIWKWFDYNLTHVFFETGWKKPSTISLRRNDWIESRGQRQAPQAPQAPTSRESTKGRGYSYIS